MITSMMNTKLKYPMLVVGVIFLFFTLNISTFAAEGSSDSLDWMDMAKGLFGGLALFLFGMEQMSDALKSALGEQMKVLLGRLTRNRFSGALTGAAVTAVVQSSSVTTVLVVGFVSAGMMSMSQSIGVIMGANVGTTVTAQIVAFKVEEAALWMIFIGFLMMFLAKRESVKHYGNMLMGLGLIFFGMSLMGDGMRPLRSYEPFIELMTSVSSNYALAILLGAIFTALVQSSSATTAIVITMAGQGLISLEAGIALAFGANIGTCVTAQLAALGKPIEAKRAAMVHLLFNVTGVIIWLPLISVLATWVIGVSPTHPELDGMARLSAEVPRQIANAHTVFNIINTLIFIGFTGYMAKLVVRLLPARVVEEKAIIRPRYLDEALIETPAIALQNVRFEIARMGEIVSQMFSELRQGLLERDRKKLENVRSMDDKLDVLEAAIFSYLGEVRKQELTQKESEDIGLAMSVTDEFESIGDVMETDLVNLGYHAMDRGLKASDALKYLYQQLGDKLAEAIELTVRAVKDLDELAADQVLTMKADIDHLISEAIAIQTEALAHMDEDQVERMRMEMTALENLKRIHTYLKRIARKILPREVRD